MKKEYTLALIGGLFLLSYVLEAVINPLTLNLATPYDYLQPQYLTRYPFTSAIIFIRALAIFLTPVFLISFLPQAWFAKGVGLLILAGLLQLYSLQTVLNQTAVVPLEWALSLAIAGMALLLPTTYYLLRGFFTSMHQSLVKSVSPPPPTSPTNPSPGWLSEPPSRRS